MKAQNKFFITFLLILFIILFFFNIDNVFATNIIEDYEVPDKLFDAISSTVSKNENGFYYRTGSTFTDTSCDSYVILTGGNYDWYLVFFLDSNCYYNNSTIYFLEDNNKPHAFWVAYSMSDFSIVDQSHDYNTYYYPPTRLNASLIFKNLVYSTFDIKNQDGTVFFKGSVIDNNYNYDDYVLPELPKDLYKYNYIIKSTNTVSEETLTVYMLHSHSSPLEFYNGGCSSCREDCMPDCPESPISYCDHILSFGSAKVYTYAPSLYPSNDTYGGNSLWTLFSDQTYFPSSWEHHFHWGTSLKDVLVYSDFTISPKDISGNVVDVLDPNDYEDFKDDVIDNNADYVINENYYNNVEDKSFSEKVINFFTNFDRIFTDLLKSIFVPKDGYFEAQMELIKNKLNEKTHYQDYLDSLKEIESISDATGDTDEITTHIDLNNYSITDKLTINMSKFIDFSIFNNFKSTWYSWVRVVTYIGLVIYNINQITKLFNGFGAVEGSIRDVQNNIKGSDKR